MVVSIFRDAIIILEPPEQDELISSAGQARGLYPTPLFRVVSSILFPGIESIHQTEEDEVLQIQLAPLLLC